MRHSHALRYAECSALLRSGVAGRLALSTPDGPHIVPLNYAVVDSAIIVRTSPYSVLGTHGRDAVVAFEVDHVDAERQGGWSVVARAAPRSCGSARRSSTSARCATHGPGRAGAGSCWCGSGGPS